MLPLFLLGMSHNKYIILSINFSCQQCVKKMNHYVITVKLMKSLNTFLPLTVKGLC